MAKQRSGAWKFWLGAGASLLALAGYRKIARRMDFAGKVIVITGGSRGLGLEMARLLAEQGAVLALVARDAAELDRAAAELPGAVQTIASDVTQPGAIDRAIRQVLDRAGRIDVLINNAGIVHVGPAEHMNEDDYRQALDTHFWAPYYAIRAVWPTMRRQGGGRIVNIGSIGGLVGLPHLAPYSASKHALHGLSTSLAAELARDGIRLTTVHPGLMRTGSHLHGLFKGQHRREYTWFSHSMATPVTSMSSRRAAVQVLRALRYASPVRVLTWQARLASIFEALFPNLYVSLTRFANRLLPPPTGASGDVVRLGRDSQSRSSPSFITTLIDRAAERNNQLNREQ